MFTVENLKKKDVKALKKLIEEVGNLDQNSSYLYLILSHYFNESCLVAKFKNEIAGFVTAIVKKDTIFIWQIGVKKDCQTQGVALNLLQHLMDRQSKNIKNMEFTISDSNSASLALFMKFAKLFNGQIRKTDKFEESLFLEKDHEKENLYNIELPENFNYLPL